MATPRLLTSLLSKQSRSIASYSVRRSKDVSVASTTIALPALRFHSFQSRCYSQEASKPSKIYSFEDVKALTEKPDPRRILIDTREPGELQNTGKIPGSVNIPVTSRPEAFFLPAEEFEDRFGFERPEKDQEVVFYCKSGVRSRAAAELAKRAGWTCVAEYPGSWLNWENSGGAKEGGRS